MALNDTFNNPQRNTTSLEGDITSYLPKKEYWAEECKEHPSKKECLFYCN